VVGDYSPNGTETIYGFADSNGRFMSLAYPGATQTFPEGINNSGVVVGTANNQSSVYAFWVKLQ
jgi:hypothetical protein